jgi:hypothetical protein
MSTGLDINEDNIDILNNNDIFNDYLDVNDYNDFADKNPYYRLTGKENPKTKVRGNYLTYKDFKYILAEKPFNPIVLHYSVDNVNEVRRSNTRRGLFVVYYDEKAGVIREVDLYFKGNTNELDFQKKEEYKEKIV